MPKAAVQTPFRVPFSLLFLSVSLQSLFNRAMTQRSNALKPDSSPVSFPFLQMLLAEDICWSAEDVLLG